MDVAADQHLEGPGGLPRALLADLTNTVFKGKSFKFHKTDPKTGTREVVEIKG